jgi:hypothetical protein
MLSIIVFHDMIILEHNHNFASDTLLGWIEFVVDDLYSWYICKYDDTVHRKRVSINGTEFCPNEDVSKPLNSVDTQITNKSMVQLDRSNCHHISFFLIRRKEDNCCLLAFTRGGAHMHWNIHLCMKKGYSSWSDLAPG